MEFDFVVIVSQRHVTFAESCFSHMFGLSPVFVIVLLLFLFISNVTRTSLVVVFLTLSFRHLMIFVTIFVILSYGEMSFIQILLGNILWLYLLYFANVIEINMVFS